MTGLRRVWPRALGVVICGALASAFMGASAGGPATDQAKADATRGREIFLRQKCILCHKVGQSGGVLGPELTTVGERKDAEWLLRYLPKPQAFDPKNKMPPVAVTGRDLEDLVAYLVSLKGKTRGD
jgi:cytochrome c oxidase subunit 2